MKMQGRRWEAFIFVFLMVAIVGPASPAALAKTKLCVSDGVAAQEKKQQAGVDTTEYGRLLHAYVTDEGWVDYTGLA
ncbi:MAG: hypothetical protein JSS69_18955, partial [Acidobacteria bacterium]|nr:hypothetical protein [Acidobacteriota bacterium]